MNLDELSEKIKVISSEKVVACLAKSLLDWKESSETASELKEGIERYIGNSWIEKNEDHKNIYNLWSSFRNEVIMGIGGMTMNERLYFFGLSERFDACENEESKLQIYSKLHAKP